MSSMFRGTEFLTLLSIAVPCPQTGFPMTFKAHCANFRWGGVIFKANKTTNMYCPLKVLTTSYPLPILIGSTLLPTEWQSLTQTNTSLGALPCTPVSGPEGGLQNGSESCQLQCYLHRRSRGWPPENLMAKVISWNPEKFGEASGSGVHGKGPFNNLPLTRTKYGLISLLRKGMGLSVVQRRCIYTRCASWGRGKGTLNNPTSIALVHPWLHSKCSVKNF